MKPDVILCVGHSREGDNGAVSLGGVSEWDYNAKVASAAAAMLRPRGLLAQVVTYYAGRNYAEACRLLGKRLAPYGRLPAVELHFNAGHALAAGYEAIVYPGSVRGRRLGEMLVAAHGKRFPESKCRGVKDPGPGKRGLLWLKSMPGPAVIWEPFFGSSAEEWARHGEDPEGVAAAVVDGILSFMA